VLVAERSDGSEPLPGLRQRRQGMADNRLGFRQDAAQMIA